QDKGDLLVVAQVSEPVPGEHAFAGDDQAVTVGGDSLEEGLGVGRDGLLQGGLPLGVQDVEGQGPDVEIDATVESVPFVVEPHRGLRVGGTLGGWLLPSVSEAKGP